MWPLPHFLQATRQYLQANGLFLAILAASVAGHASLKWIGFATALEPQMAELERGLTSVQVHWIAASEAVETAETAESDEFQELPEIAETELLPDEEVSAEVPVDLPRPAPAEILPDRQDRQATRQLPERARAAREPDGSRNSAAADRQIPERAVHSPPHTYPPAETQPPQQTAPADRPVRELNLDADVPLTVVSEEASGQEVPPSFLTRPLPPYPRELLLQGVEGTVQVRVTIDRRGQVTETALHRSSGYPEMDASALQTVRRWTFQPARRGNVAVATSVIVPVEFTIRVRNRGR